MNSSHVSNHLACLVIIYFSVIYIYRTKSFFFDSMYICKTTHSDWTKRCPLDPTFGFSIGHGESRIVFRNEEIIQIPVDIHLLPTAFYITLPFISYVFVLSLGRRVNASMGRIIGLEHRSIYLFIYLSLYLSIYHSINLSIDHALASS